MAIKIGIDAGGKLAEFLTQDDKALAIPKIVGLIISIVSCVWIADAGNGFL